MTLLRVVCCLSYLVSFPASLAARTPRRCLGSDTGANNRSDDIMGANAARTCPLGQSLPLPLEGTAHRRKATSAPWRASSDATVA